MSSASTTHSTIDCSQSHGESAIIRCLFFNGLTVVLLCVGLLNISTGLYLGFYLLVSHSVTRML